MWFSYPLLLLFLVQSLIFAPFLCSVVVCQYFLGYIMLSVSLFCSVCTFNHCISEFSFLSLVLLGLKFFGKVSVFLFQDSLYQLSLINFDFQSLFLSAGSCSPSKVVILYIEVSVVFSCSSPFSLLFPCFSVFFCILLFDVFCLSFFFLFLLSCFCFLCLFYFCLSCCIHSLHFFSGVFLSFSSSI